MGVSECERILVVALLKRFSSAKLEIVVVDTDESVPSASLVICTSDLKVKLLENVFDTPVIAFEECSDSIVANMLKSSNKPLRWSPFVWSVLTAEVILLHLYYCMLSALNILLQLTRTEDDFIVSNGSNSFYQTFELDPKLSIPFSKLLAPGTGTVALDIFRGAKPSLEEVLLIARCGCVCMSFVH